MVVGASEDEVRQWRIQLEIHRGGNIVFTGETGLDQIKRTFAELIEYLFRSQTFPRGAMLLTGAGIVPPDTFTLAEGDHVRITVSGIGTLENTVAVV
jgi:2-dehydro-3-deoxy-D-arabinonate dehydratase